MVGGGGGGTTGANVLLKDWDLWGPLLLCLSALVFALVFALVWVGALVVTLNAQLLGGELSVLQSVCVLGYCIFPMLIAALLTSIWSHLAWRIGIVLACWFWATFASRAFLVDSVPSNKRLLAIYPIALFYLTIGWMVLVQ
ncbi:YIPF6 protein [Thecamonas trahens ATCC 50062]|uniref:Protein YIPF n=1 Tax=Thecamonas trahens ATCC 50062 TaxID=461836 RepID=A0A0L0D9K4_THETB|nr:YIPF6 protein [Thecamonas trahens ATCC 50062]KNC49047.1 YIPF6 protein [Thecamonas trahens ATCC 50062]|eukprot:XP_013758082.1 YIPF6 protein [Thecamonas trahens ATCC 50062]